MPDFDINPDKYNNRARRTRATKRTQARRDDAEATGQQPRQSQPPRQTSLPRDEHTSSQDAVITPVHDNSPSGDVPAREEPRRKRPRVIAADRPDDNIRIESEPRAAAEPKTRRTDLLGPFRDRRVHIFIGVLLISIGVVMGVVLISHLSAAGADQSRVLNQTISEMASDGKVVNKGGPFGAWLSHALFTDAFGVGSFVIAIYLILVGACIIAVRKFNFWALTFKSVLLALTMSVLCGLITYSSDTELVWGGTHGHGINKYLFDNAGFVGALAVSVILLAAVICAFYFPLGKLYRRIRGYLNEMSERRRSRYAATAAQAEAVPYQQPYAPAPGMSPENVAEVPAEAAAVPLDEEAPSDTSAYSGGAAMTVTPTADDETAFSFDDDEVEAEHAAPERPAEPDTNGDKTMAATDNRADRHTGIPSTEKKDVPFEVTLTHLDVNQPDSDDSPAKPQPVSRVRRDHRDGLYGFRQPSLELLDNMRQSATIDEAEQERNRTNILDTLAQFHVGIRDIKATIGPTVTLYELILEDGVRPQDIKRLEENLAMGLRSKNVRVVTLTQNGTVGIEVPNANPQTVSMRSVLASNRFQSSSKPLPIALGATIQNEVYIANIAKMPHLLVAGATGQGKSVGLNAIITSLLFKKHPTELKFVLIDPKMVEFSLYSALKNHYLAKLNDDDDDAIITDMNKVLSVLNSLCVEMDDRYELLKKAGEREIEGYNAKFERGALNEAEGHKYLPYLVLIIDEFADLILTGGKEIETPVMRIAQKGRAAGMHMIIATQRPSRQVLTGLIKANCPARIAFRVTQRIDSSIILDEMGADSLIGRGDMIYKNGDDHERVQCAFISNQEVERVVAFIASQPGPGQPYYLPDPVGVSGGDGMAACGPAGATMGRDEMFDEVARAVVAAGQGSTSWIQRNYGFGYNRAGKLMDQMCAAGIVGPVNGSKPRAILVDPMTLEDILAQKGDRR